MASEDDHLARDVLERGERATLSPVDKVLAGIASIASEGPWTFEPEDLSRARAAGIEDRMLVQAIALSAFFNYLNRVADGIDLDCDYETVLPKYRRDAAREPTPRPAVPRTAPGMPDLSLSLLNRTPGALREWKSYMLDRCAPLTPSQRRVLARASARALADGMTLAELNEPSEAVVPEAPMLRAFAEKLTLTPWRLVESDLDPLRALGLDDAGVLDVVSVIAYQNTMSRVRLAIAL